jgi:hypothetical protein
MEVADRIGLELLTRLSALHTGQAADVVALEQAVKAGAGEMRDRCLECIEAIIERQQRMRYELCHHTVGLNISGGAAAAR